MRQIFCLIYPGGQLGRNTRLPFVVARGLVYKTTQLSTNFAVWQLATLALAHYPVT